MALRDLFSAQRSVENLDLIDWPMVGFASLWILGLALMLTTFGFADYHAGHERKKAREILKRSEYQVPINAGIALFCLGLLGSSRSNCVS